MSSGSPIGDVRIKKSIDGNEVRFFVPQGMKCADGSVKELVRNGSPVVDKGPKVSKLLSRLERLAKV